MNPNLRSSKLMLLILVFALLLQANPSLVFANESAVVGNVLQENNDVTNVSYAGPASSRVWDLGWVIATPSIDGRSFKMTVHNMSTTNVTNIRITHLGYDTEGMQCLKLTNYELATALGPGRSITDTFYSSSGKDIHYVEFTVSYKDPDGVTHSIPGTCPKS